MPGSEFICWRCGNCCKANWEIIVDFKEDILRWIGERRFDILKRIVLNPKFILNPEHFSNTPQWMIDNGHILFGDIGCRCPFLEEPDPEIPAKCRIHNTRPMVCRSFPYDEGNNVRGDVLDVCKGSIFYYSELAVKNGSDFLQYLDSISPKKNKPLFNFKKEDLRSIASFFRNKGLIFKVNFTSETGLKIAEQLIDTEKPYLEKDFTKILSKVLYTA